ncbi:MAG: response regulator [Burkholderiaceae bacterium]|nr:response regulator [Burkholderiaceae bacterium]
MEEERPYHLFVVEDDVALRGMLCHYLGKQGLRVTALCNAEDLLQRIHRVRPDLVILDVGLPAMSGLDACRHLRAHGDRMPIILLSAHNEAIDRVVGLEMGADDYLGKPFSARELLSRVRAVLRRATFIPGAPQGSSASIVIGDFVFEVAARRLKRGEEFRVLNTVEYAMLAELATNPGIAVSRERLVAASHTRRDAVSLRAVDATVVRLRKALEPNPAVPRYIQTVRGHGYVFVPSDAKVLA